MTYTVTIIGIMSGTSNPKKGPSEGIGLMEPMRPSGNHPELSNLVLDLVAESNRLAGMLHPKVRASVGDLVRSMNCYYSNLIEGHDTHPRDIDRALAKDYSKDGPKRALQKEAVAHIEVQRLIDRGEDPAAEPASRAYVLWLHQEFCGRLPAEMLRIENPRTKKSIALVPGALRDTRVVVGRHEPPRPENLPPFLARFEEAYAAPGLSNAERIISVGAAHHRFLWIHPFLDGNGRVARLMSYAMLKRLGAGGPLWSVARGLARRVDHYKALLQNADERRENDYDGRGTLSEKALVAFCRFFLEISIDQVRYMTSLLDPAEFLNRMRIHVEEETGAGRLPRGSAALLREAWLSGEFERGRAGELTGYGERRARETVAALGKRRLLVSDGPRTAVRLGFPVDVVGRWFPQLYPASVER